MNSDFLEKISLDNVFDSPPDPIRPEQYKIDGDERRITVYLNGICFSFVKISIWEDRTLLLQNNGNITFFTVDLDNALGRELVNRAREYGFQIEDNRITQQ